MADAAIGPAGIEVLHEVRRLCRGPGDGALNFRAELFALPAVQRLEVLTLTLAEQVAAVLGVPTDAIDHHTPLAELGLDSLSSVELASRVAATLDIRISAGEFERLPRLSAIAKQSLAVAEVSRNRKQTSGPDPQLGVSSHSSADDLHATPDVTRPPFDLEDRPPG